MSEMPKLTLVDSDGSDGSDGTDGGDRRKYSRTHVVLSSLTMLAVGATAGWLLPKALESHEASAAPLTPAAVATRLGNTCLNKAGTVTTDTPDRVVKKVGPLVTCEVDWTKGKLSGVVISQSLLNNLGEQDYAVFKPSDMTPTSWLWSISGNFGTLGTSPTSMIRADTFPDGSSAGYQVYGCKGPDDCNYTGTITDPDVPGAQAITSGLLKEIDYLSTQAMAHPDQP